MCDMITVRGLHVGMLAQVEMRLMNVCATLNDSPTKRSWEFPFKATKVNLTLQLEEKSKLHQSQWET